MTRMYLSPTATVSAKIFLILIECLIGLFNLVSFPIRKITPKLYAYSVAIFGAYYVFSFRTDIQSHLTAFLITAIGFGISVFVVKFVHKILNKKVGPKIAYMINSPFGIRLNRYYVPADHIC